MNADEFPIQRVFERLANHFGPQRWWPADTPFEVMVGAVLTQHTAWSNVEKAIANLKATDQFSPHAILALSREELEDRIQPAGLYRVKAERLCALLMFFVDCFDADISQMAAQPAYKMRRDLLAIRGIGPETADCILLYALGKPIFVVDAYARRVFGRLKLVDEAIDYDDLQQFFMRHLPRDAALFNEYHALIVAQGKDHCKPKPKCATCPLVDLCAFGHDFGRDGH